MVIDQMALAGGWRARFGGQFQTIPGDVALLKPGTFMNRSGESVRSVSELYGLQPQEVLVVHDELDLPFGRLRLKLGGGEAGHNGLRSVSQHLGDRNYYRLRVGVGRPSAEFSGTVSDFVLDAFAAAETVQLSDVVRRGADAIRLFSEQGPQAAMNDVNRKR